MEWRKRFTEKLVWQLLSLVMVIFFLLLCAFLFTSRHTAKLLRQNTLELSQERLSSAQSRLDSFLIIWKMWQHRSLMPQPQSAI